jgi:hypothetical protein
MCWDVILVSRVSLGFVRLCWVSLYELCYIELVSLL